MTRVYATTDRPEDKPILAYVECDRCDAKAKPGTEELLEDWSQFHVVEGGVVQDTLHYCKSCSYGGRW